MTENPVKVRKRVVRRQYSTNPPDEAFLNLNLIDPTGKRLIPVRKKPEGLICSICDAPAHGYNFDAITCESCKAFFRRNALKCQVN